MRLSIHKVGKKWEARLAEPCPRGAMINYQSIVDYEIKGQTFHVFRTFSSTDPDKAKAKAIRWAEKQERKRKEVFNKSQQEAAEYMASEELCGNSHE